MLFSTITHTKPTITQQENHQNTTTHHHNNNKKIRDQRESKKSKSHRNVDWFMGRSKSHKKSKSHRERDRFVGSWREGSGSPAKSKARGSKALGWRLVRGFVDRWVEGFGSKIGLWVRRSAKSKAWSGLSLLPLSLSLSLRVSPEMVWSENFDWNQFSGQNH